MADEPEVVEQPAVETPPAAETPPVAQVTEPAVDWQARYSNLEKDHSRAAQEAAQFRKDLEQIRSEQQALLRDPEALDYYLKRARGPAAPNLAELPIDKAIEMGAEPLVRRTIGPIEQRLQAAELRMLKSEIESEDRTMSSRFPDYGTYRDKVIEFAKEHPDLSLESAYHAIRGSMTYEQSQREAAIRANNRLATAGVNRAVPPTQAGTTGSPGVGNAKNFADAFKIAKASK